MSEEDKKAERKKKVEMLKQLFEQLVALGSYSSRTAHEIGEKIHNLGGSAAMYGAHLAVKRKWGDSAARSLEGTWDGIGDWRG